MAFIATLLRVYVRIHLVKSFGWDDAWMMAALLTHIMFATCAIAGAHYGTGRYFDDISGDGIFMAMRYWWLCYIAYCLTMIEAKISIGLFLLRVTVSRLQRTIIYVAMGLTVLTGIVFFFVTLFQCAPVSFFWNKDQPGTCVNIDVIIGLTFLYSAVSAICDFTFGLLPVWLVWGLNMRKSEKMALIPILSMGCIASTAVIVRMAFVMDFRSPEFLHDTVDIAIWSDIEQGLAITAGSLATLRPLYRVITARLGWSLTSTNPLSDKKGSSPFPRSGLSSGNQRRKKSGPFSLITLTRHDGPSEEYGLENCRPVKLRDDLADSIDSDGRPNNEKGFNTWRIQVGDGSEEELNSAKNTKMENGITRKTDIYTAVEGRR